MGRDEVARGARVDAGNEFRRPRRLGRVIAGVAGLLPRPVEPTERLSSRIDHVPSIGRRLVDGQACRQEASGSRAWRPDAE